MRPAQRSVLFQTSALVAVALFLARFISISRHYPYYFAWDMDYVTTLDTLLIRSGLLPDHINHPCFGMYLILGLTQRVARLFDVISVGSLTDLSGSLSPLAGMAELTTFNRLHTPFLLLAIVLFLWLALGRLVRRLPAWAALLVLLLLGTQESLAYHAAMIRTEAYSLFYWSAAVLVAMAAAKARRPALKNAGLLLCGLLLGLAFLTKIQSLLYLTAVPLLFLLGESFAPGGRAGEAGVPSRRSAGWTFGLSLFCVASFALLLVASWRTAIPKGLGTFTDTYAVTPLAILTLLALLGLCLVTGFLVLRNRQGGPLFRHGAMLTLLAAGFLGSLLFHFVVFKSPALSLTYLLYDFKIMFLRRNYYSVENPFAGGGPLAFLAYNPWLLAVHLALLALLAVGTLGGALRLKRRQLALCAALSFVALANLLLGTRFILRDVLWVELLLNWLSLVYFGLLLTRMARPRRGLTWAASGALAVLLLVNLAHSRAMSTRLAANYNLYGWKEERWLTKVFSANHLKYEALMKAKYQPSMTAAARAQADNEARIRDTVQSVFQNQSLTLRNIGVVEGQFPVWAADQGYRISALDPSLKGTIVVDNLALPVARGPFFTDELVRKPSEYLDKIKKTGVAEGTLGILPRYDLQVLLFIPAAASFKPGDPNFKPTYLRLTVTKNGQPITMQGLLVTNYVEVPVRDFPPHSFFIIRRK